MQTNKLWMFSCTFVNVFVPLMIVCSAHGGFVASVCPSPGSCSVRPRVALFRLFMCTLHFTNGQTPALHAIHHSSFGYRLPARCRLVVRSRAYTIPAGILAWWPLGSYDLNVCSLALRKFAFRAGLHFGIQDSPGVYIMMGIIDCLCLIDKLCGSSRV